MPRILTNKYGFPEPLLRALSFDGYEKRGYISVTSLIDSPKVRLIRNNFEYYEDVSDLVWSVQGSAMHTVLERACEMISKYDRDNGILEPRYIAEHKMDYKFLGHHLTDNGEGVHITGTLDLLHVLKPRILFDYKNTTVWKIIKCKKTVDERGSVIYKAGKDDVVDWQKQLNMYAHMYYKLHGIKIEKIRVIVFVKDWTAREAYKEDYPEKPVVMVDIPVYSDESIEKFIVKRIETHYAAERIFNTEGIDAVPECTPEERWSSPPTYKIMPYEGAKRAISGGVYEITSKEEENKAIAHYNALKLNDSKIFLKKVLGEDRRCENYCPLKIHCHYFKSKNT